MLGVRQVRSTFSLVVAMHAGALEPRASAAYSSSFPGTSMVSLDSAPTRPCCPSMSSSADWGILWDTSDFPPRWRCGTWTPVHGWTHIISDLAIWGAYTSIPILLIYYIRKRKDMPFPRIFWLFAAFILACGTVHLIEAAIFWYPIYRISALGKMITAVVSWVTVIALLPILPRALSLPGIEKINIELRAELARRLAAEEALKEREGRLEAIFHSSPDAIITMNDQGTIETMNNAAEHIFGYPRAEAVGRRVSDLMVPPDLRDAHNRALARLVETKEARLIGQRLELSGLRADGSEFPAEVSIAAVNRGDRQLFVGRVRDLTETKRADERFRLAVEAAPNAMVMVNERGNIVMVNSRTEQLFGYTRDELMGQPIETLLPEALRPTHLRDRAQYLADPKPRMMGGGRDLHGRRKNGSLVAVEIGLNPIRTKEGLVVLSAIVDITERKRIERELHDQSLLLRKQNLELNARNKDLDEFSYIASHDLQEPLRKLVSFSSLLKTDLGGDLSEDARKDLEYIADAAKRMQCLVSDLLELSRTGSGPFGNVPVSLSDCVDKAMTALSVRIEETGAEIRRIDLPRIQGDPLLISQLYQNLMGNALKFRRPDVAPMLELTAERTGDGWIFGVKDNGIGIPRQHLEQVFAPFKRLHGRNEFEGTGIGLAICKKAVERHGGRIWVESEPGVGSHFRFTLGSDVIDSGTVNRDNTEARPQEVMV